jgi:hypothetical protein
MLRVTKPSEGLEQSDTLAKTLWFGPEVRPFDPSGLHRGGLLLCHLSKRAAVFDRHHFAE